MCLPEGVPKPEAIASTNWGKIRSSLVGVLSLGREMWTAWPTSVKPSAITPHLNQSLKQFRKVKNSRPFARIRGLRGLLFRSHANSAITCDHGDSFFACVTFMKTPLCQSKNAAPRDGLLISSGCCFFLPSLCCLQSQNG